MKFVISQEQLGEIITYLASRPWGEVNNLIAIISKLEKIEDEKITKMKK